MKHLAIASIVGSIILYVFLALGHMMLHLHDADYKYTPAQDSILSYLSSTLKEDGLYALPYLQPGASSKEQQNLMEYFMAGNPSAMVNFHARSEYSPMMYLMSFIYNFISILIICIALAAASGSLKSFGQRLWFIMLFAAFAIFSNVMMQYNWDQFPMHYLSGSILDTTIGYFCAGIWLTWYYGKIAAKNS
jgi:hypothetical protein